MRKIGIKGSISRDRIKKITEYPVLEKDCNSIWGERCVYLEEILKTRIIFTAFWVVENYAYLPCIFDKKNYKTRHVEFPNIDIEFVFKSGETNIIASIDNQKFFSSSNKNVNYEEKEGWNIRDFSYLRDYRGITNKRVIEIAAMAILSRCFFVLRKNNWNIKKTLKEISEEIKW